MGRGLYVSNPGRRTAFADNILEAEDPAVGGHAPVSLALG